jgi:nitroreductase
VCDITSTRGQIWIPETVKPAVHLPITLVVGDDRSVSTSVRFTCGGCLIWCVRLDDSAATTASLSRLDFPDPARLPGACNDYDEERIMDAIEILRTLRAVRSYSGQPVPRQVVHDILEVARWTGSAKNTQPWELIVVADRASLQRLASLGQYAGHLAGAALGVVLVMEGPGRDFDAGRLAQSIMVAAWAYGLGSCIASLFPADNEQRARHLLGVPEGRALHTVIALGYPAGTEALRLRSAPQNVRSAVPAGRRPLAALVSWEQYGHHAESVLDKPD